MKNYPLFKVHIPIEEALANIRTVFESGFINEGIQVTEFTNEISKVLCSDKLIVLNSCTSALTLALHLAGAGPASEVISTPMTCVATNTPIRACRAKIVWADIDPKTGMIDYGDVFKKITNDTVAVMAVAWAGSPPELDKLATVCKMSNTKLILDAAHAFGAEHKGKPIHEWADYTTYSLQAIKHVTTGDGGILICKDQNDYQRSKCLKWFGLDRDHAKDKEGNWKGQQWDVDIKEAGYKFNMNNVSAAIGLSQLKYIPQILEQHRTNAKLYSELFTNNKNVVCVDPSPGSSYWVYPMHVLADDRDKLIANLNAEGIMAGLVHVPNDDYTAFKNIKTPLPGVRAFSQTQLNLPCGWWLTRDDVKYIANRVKYYAKEGW